MKRRRILPFGAEIAGAGVRFRLWAPDADAVFLCLEDGPELPMEPEPEGWFSVTTALATAGSRYRYRIGDERYPDPAARSQPGGVFGASEVFDPIAHDWADLGWAGIARERAVLYELHVGAFSSEGDFAGIARHLDHLAALGVTLIELMPVADCPGRWNWGYDGVLSFAPAQRYGGPAALKQLVETCHSRGIGVILDVVYNHFGPAGNFLHAYAGSFFSRHHTTPWGQAINFDEAGAQAVRQFFIENARYWLEEYHLDGLRFDAVHTIVDSSTVPFVNELGDRLRHEFPDRVIHLILENDRNDPTLLGQDRGGPGPFDAQWNDDFHHALRVVLTDARGGYYEDYRDDPVGCLGRALAEGFVYQGDASPYRGGRPRGAPSAGLPPGAFINFCQNHDQIGNHAYGWRLAKFVGGDALRAAAALVLLTPSTPMLFMGEEWAATTPFPYFCDFEGELAQAIRQGRLAEFGSFMEFREKSARNMIPDPLAEATFLAAKLHWAEAACAEHAALLALYEHLAALRHRHIAPLLAAGGSPKGRFERFGAGGLMVDWALSDRRLTLLANLSPLKSDIGVPVPETAIYRSHPAEPALPPWFVALALDPMVAE